VPIEITECEVEGLGLLSLNFALLERAKMQVLMKRNFAFLNIK